MLSTLLSYLLLYRYAVLSWAIIAASVGIPLPATALLMAAGAFAAQGYFDMAWVLACAFSGSVLGDLILYGCSFRYGTSVLHRMGFRKILSSDAFRATEGLFVRHSSVAIIASRFLVTSLGPMVNILAGLSKTRPTRFIVCDIMGEAAYALLFAGLGYAFGDQWEAILSLSDSVAYILVLLIALAVAIAMIIRRRRRRQQAI